MDIHVKIAKLNETRVLDVESLPPTSLAYAITYGITQSVNDVHASVQRKNFTTDELYFAAVRDKVEKRWDQLVTGNVPGSRAPSDPKSVAARKFVKLAAETLGESEVTDEEMVAALAVIKRNRAKAEARA